MQSYYYQIALVCIFDDLFLKVNTKERLKKKQQIFYNTPKLLLIKVLISVAYWQQLYW